jgi:hypothetical protein
VKLTTRHLMAFADIIGDLSVRALEQGGEPLLDQVTTDLAVATRHLERIRTQGLPLSAAVQAEIDASIMRAASRLRLAC